MRQDGESELENTRKRPRGTQNIDTYQMISSVLEEQQSRRRNKVELAIQLLQNEYQERLSPVAFVEAIDVLTNEARASVFITLNSNSIRDLWLCKNANIQLESNTPV
jgi:hypothetical protein